nr:MAG TPA: ribonucleotide-diphosphate reductase subunit beta [Caudoviricetes sp.]
MYGLTTHIKCNGSFSFAERKLMEGNAKIIKLISRKLHCGFYQ